MGRQRSTARKARWSTIAMAYAGVLLAVACNGQSSSQTTAALSQATTASSASAGVSNVVPDANAAPSVAAEAPPLRARVEIPPGFVTFQEKVPGVGTLAFIPPNETTALSSGDNVTRVWDVVGGTVLRRYEGPEWSFPTVVFTRDGTYAFSSVEGGVKQWEVATGRIVRRFAMNPKNFPYLIVLSPDERRLAATAWEAAFVWSVASGDVLRQPDAGGSHTFGYLDNATLGWVDLVGALCRAATTGEEPPTCSELDGGGGINNALFAGRHVVASDKWGDLMVWDARTGEYVRSWDTDSPNVEVGAVTPSGLLVTTSASQKVKVWQLPYGREVARRAINSSNSAVAISSDGRQVLLTPRSNIIARWTLP